LKALPRHHFCHSRCCDAAPDSPGAAGFGGGGGGADIRPSDQAPSRISPTGVNFRSWAAKRAA